MMEEKQKSNSEIFFKSINLGLLGLIIGSCIHDSNEPKEIRPIKINGTNGYNIVTSHRTNYYIYTGNFNVKQINPDEQIRTNVPIKKQIETQIETNYPKYKIERILEGSNR